MAKIYAVKASSIYDSNGWPTVEVTVWLDNGAFGVSSAPSSVHTDETEMIELRDGDQQAFFGNGVSKAIDLINNQISPKLRGLDPTRQSAVDQILLEMDSTPNKKVVGINTILPISQAVLKSGASLFQMPLYEYMARKYQLTKGPVIMPVPIVTIINGGIKSLGNIDFSEFHIIPSSRYSTSQALQISSEMSLAVEKSLIGNNAINSVGPQGGYTPNLFTNLDALELISESVKFTKYFLGQDLFLGIDVQADNLVSGSKYIIKDRSKKLSQNDFIAYFEEINKKYHIFGLEDPLISSDWKGWQDVTEKLGTDTLIIADHLTACNKTKIAQAVKLKACTAIVIKPNQIGSVTECMQIISQVKSAGINVIIANRLGETTDTYLADLAVGVGAAYVKFGGMARGERIVKYNRLLQISESLKATAA